jgi:hypothetical protein
LRLPHDAFVDGSAQNMPAVFPHVFLGDGPCVAFRRFRPRGQKSFGWDACITRLCSGEWTEPARVSPSYGAADAACDFVATDRGVLGLLPACDHQPILAYEEEVDPPPKRTTQPARRFRIEVVRLDDEGAESLPDPPSGRRGVYTIAPPVYRVAPEPPATPEPARRELIWADLHAHSAYSKCMSANDGLPDDVLRRVYGENAARLLGLNLQAQTPS